MKRLPTKVIVSFYLASIATLSLACYGSIVTQPTLPTSATCDGSGGCTTGNWTDGQCGSDSDASGYANCTPGNKKVNFPNFVPPAGCATGGACTQSGTIPNYPAHTAKGTGTCGGGG